MLYPHRNSMVQAIQTIEQDFIGQNGPFADATLPEAEAIEQTCAPITEFLTLGVTLDYNRDATRLWANMVELSVREPNMFHAHDVAEMDLSEMQALFADIGFRYPNRDAKAWYDNCQVIVEKFNGSWSDFIRTSGYDAVKLAEVIQYHGIKYLQGDKLCPFYVKIVDAHIHDLENVWQLDIPVDVHIRRLTQRFVGKEISDDEIRTFWHEYGRENDISAMTVDTALWLIGNNWDDWGEDYFDTVK